MPGSGAGAASARGSGAVVRISKPSVTASPGNVKVAPAGPVAFSSMPNASPTVTSALLAVAFTDTGEGAIGAGDGAAVADAARSSETRTSTTASSRAP